MITKLHYEWSERKHRKIRDINFALLFPLKTKMDTFALINVRLHVGRKQEIQSTINRTKQRLKFISKIKSNSYMQCEINCA